MVEKMGGQIKILDSKKRDKMAENLLSAKVKTIAQPHSEVPTQLQAPVEESWKDTHAQRILGTKLVKQALYKNEAPGTFFPDESFSTDLLSLLCTHP